jgi:hypothetical protein
MIIALVLIIIFLILVRSYQNRGRKSNPFMRTFGKIRNVVSPMDTMVVIRPDTDKPQSIDERASYYYKGEQRTADDGVSDEDKRWYDTVFNGGSSTKTELRLCNCGASHESMCGCGK